MPLSDSHLFLRETSCWRDAGSAKGTGRPSERSERGSTSCRGEIGFSGAAGQVHSSGIFSGKHASVSQRLVMAEHKYLTSPPKISTWPPGVPYIIGNEAAERFSYYAMNAIVVIFWTTFLRDKAGNLDVMRPEQADAWYHTFVSVLYFLPLVGAILADAFFGKFWVVFWLSIVYCAGHATLALIGSTVAHTVPPVYLSAIGLFLIALGAGGIKPCVSTNVGDQFG